MNDRTKILRIISNMKRAVTMPIVQQRLDETILLKEGEVWVAYTEAKVKEQWGDIAVTSQRLILLSEGEVVAALPHEVIDIISIASHEQAYLMSFFYNMGNFQSDVVLPTEEQARALFELIAEARGTWPFAWPQVYPPERDRSEIAVLPEPPYVTLAKKPKRNILTGKATIKFPNQCAWCGSEHVTAERQVRLYAPNPMYTSGVGRALKQATGMAVGGALGGALGAGMGSAVLGPAEVEKIKGIALNITVPHCADHADTPPEGVLSLVNAGLVSGATGRIQVRDAEYARAIARVNMGQPRPWHPPSVGQSIEQEELSASTGGIYLPTLRGLVWLDQCIVCGVRDASERYQPDVMVKGSVKLQGEGIEVPICTDDLRKLKHSGTISCLVLLIGLPVAIALGWLILTLLGDYGSGLVRWGAAFLVSLVGYGIWVFALNRIGERKLGVDRLDWKPVSITLKDGQYLLQFYNAEMAETMRQANGLAETT
jgi:hypothetical protein